LTTGATLFSGGEGVGVGMRQSGITHLWGIEWDDDIAQVARNNGFHTITADVREVDIGKLPRPDILHASPVCKNASVAKAGGKEAPEDVESAHSVTRFIETLRPTIFTLENVWGYRNFVAFDVILKCLRREGYQVDY
jgi:site-specific DNA-cytosine methylase